MTINCADFVNVQFIFGLFLDMEFKLLLMPSLILFRFNFSILKLADA